MEDFLFVFLIMGYVLNVLKCEFEMCPLR